MIKTLLIILVSTVLFSQTKSDNEAIKRAALDYLEALYKVKPELVDKSVDVTLRKYGYWYNQKSKRWTSGSEMNFKQLRSLSERWNKKGNQDLSIKSVKILDISSRTAALKLSANWGIDYMLLGKEKGTWKIINIIWQSYPPESE